MDYASMETPVGELLIVGDGEAVREIRFGEEGRRSAEVEDGWRRGGAVVVEAKKQLDEYFEGRRRAFDLPLAPSGTKFQLRAWRVLQEIPYGATRSYGEQARAMGQPQAVRAVGAANGRNPIPIVVPCHRILGGDGTLTGYAGGLHIKEFLLDLERRQSGRTAGGRG